MQTTIGDAMSFNPELGTALVIGDPHELDAGDFLDAARNVEVVEVTAVHSGAALDYAAVAEKVDTVVVHEEDFFASAQANDDFTNPSHDYVIEFIDRLAERNPHIQLVVCEFGTASVRHADNWFRRDAEISIDE